MAAPVKARWKPSFNAAVCEIPKSTNFGMFRDLHRHRLLTIERQLLSTKHGYDIPSEIISAGLEKDYRDCMSLCNDAYRNIAKTMPYEAQYVINPSMWIRCVTLIFCI
jgi:hypothetical protein